MKFYSLGNPDDRVSFETAVVRGIAPDGSLYFPESIPKLTEGELAALKGRPAVEVAFAVLWPWLDGEMTAAELREIIKQACTFDTPVVPVGDKHILELFHGPTAAFKDVAARYLAAIMGFFNARSGRTATVLVATSGDTGGAIAQGFAGVAGTRVVVLFPRGRVSQLQREQLTRVAENVTSLEVEGTFDDCQDLVKTAMGDHELSGLNLTSANSISMGRLLPQMTYYATTALAYPGHRLVVPSGNLGNLTAGVLARGMGFPIASFLAANNANDMLHRYLDAGAAEALPVVATFANAMDVGRPNNLSRLTKLFAGHEELVQAVSGTTVTDATIAQTIKNVRREHKYLLDPHTAVAWAASEAVPVKAGQPDIIVSTAAPAKFAQEIKHKTGIVVSNQALLAELRTRPGRVRHLSAEFADFKAFLLNLEKA
jgi:threonine synthase